MSEVAGAAAVAQPTPMISFMTKEPILTWHSSIAYYDFSAEGLTTLPVGHQMLSPSRAVPGPNGRDVLLGFNFSRTKKNPDKIGVFFRVSYFYSFISITVRLFNII
jgi:hypothetical protein